MREIQIFQVLGLAIFATGIRMLVDRKFVRTILEEIELSAFVSFFSGLMSFLIGFFLLSSYFSLHINWSLIITFIGLVALLKGLAFLMFPIQTVKLYRKIIFSGKRAEKLTWVVLAMGSILLYFGYIA